MTWFVRPWATASRRNSTAMRVQLGLLAALAMALSFALGGVACGGGTSDAGADAVGASPTSTSDSATPSGSTAPVSIDATAPSASTAAEPEVEAAPEDTTAVEESSELENSVPIVSARTGDEKLAPELQGISSWINSEPFTLNSQRGQVVLVDFWTYTCINCIRTLPYLKSWHEKYSDSGLVILGVHTPEFEFEHLRNNVVEAIGKFGIEYPVAQDNDYRTWRAFENRFWPAKYLIDKEGFIRYTHFGEGAYEETEEWIRNLLLEAGADLEGVSANTQPEPVVLSNARTADPGEGQTRELYAGFERNFGTLRSGSVPPYVPYPEYYQDQGGDIQYTDPGDHNNHFIYLEGLWRNTIDSLVHAQETENYEDYIAIRFYAASVNAVMAPVNAGSIRVRLTLDEAPLGADIAGVDVMFDVDDNSSYVVVDEARMYSIVDAAEFGGHELKLSSNSPEFSLFAFTFGSYAKSDPQS